jgi:hypothetical protein
VIPLPGTLVSYLAHYLLARLIYDDLVHPLARGDVSVVLVIAAIGGAAYALGRRSRRGP